MRFFIFGIFFLVTTLSMAQKQKLPEKAFMPPLDIKLYLSGTFGELRTDHLHSGIDIKTQGVEGKKVISIADGHISRIKVSPGGFGKALYITHPNGYTSVYAHLKKFNDSIAAYVKDEQYKRKSFTLNLFPDKNEFPVKQGDIIASSGNSGGSLGPHLHFEIRETATEKPVNPLFFGFPVKDYVRPRISYLKVYQLGVHEDDYAKSARRIKVDGWGLKHRLRGEDTIGFSGNLAFGIAVDDQSNDMPNRNGVYSVELYIDSVLFFENKMDAFRFSESRYINSLIDYAEFVDSKIRFLRTEIDPNNKLPVYGKVENRGIYIPTDTLVHPVKYIVKDAIGNTSELNFYIQHQLGGIEVKTLDSPPDPSQFFLWQEMNAYEQDDFKLSSPKEAFYRDFVFTHSVSPGSDELFSNIHHVHRESTPVHKYLKMSIRAENIPEHLKDNVLVVKLDENGEYSSAGGHWEGNFVSTSIREFGKYSLAVDTVAPEIRPVNIHNGKRISAYRSIKIRIDDSLAGIDEYEPSINGNWILMEYDPKNKLLTYFIDDHLPEGESLFELKVNDLRGNIATYRATLIY